MTLAPRSLLLSLPFAALTALQAQGPDPAEVRSIFREAAALAEAEGGRLWGRSLAGPLMVVDPKTRRVVATHGDEGRRLLPKDGLFAGTLPDSLSVANSAMDWGGRRWTILRWPMDSDPEGRRILLGHELFHRIQPELRLQPRDLPCPHLDTREGRLWLRLEMRALRAALRAPAGSRRPAMGDALAFRAQRRKRAGSEAALAENSQEIAEGLAEYTGLRATLAPEKALASAAEALERADKAPLYTRSFAYATGPAYALLLDEARPGWRKEVCLDSDLSRLLAEADPVLRAHSHEPPLSPYEGEILRAEEKAREGARLAHLAELRRRFDEAPLLRLPGLDLKLQFDPSRQEDVEGLGTFHPAPRFSAAWGVLEVTGGALLTPDWSQVRVPAPLRPEARPLQGPGWSLKLNPGWTLIPGSRTGDWILKPSL